MVIHHLGQTAAVQCWTGSHLNPSVCQHRLPQQEGNPSVPSVFRWERDSRSNGRKLPFDIMVIKRSLQMISVVLRLFVQHYQQLCHQKLLNPTHWTFNISWTALRHTSPHLRIYWTWSKCVKCKIQSGYQCWVPHSPQSPLHRDCPSPLQKEDRVDLGYMTSEKAYRIVLAGDANVGKSSFLLRLCKNEFTFNSSSTLGEHSSQLFVNH